jgi:polyribonucleotide nucleotidyltransferase
MEALQIPSDKIGFLIGPGGKNIKAMQEQYKVKISVIDDAGNIQVFGTDSKLVKECANAIRSMTETPKIGTRYVGTVKSARDFAPSSRSSPAWRACATSPSSTRATSTASRTW